MLTWIAGFLILLVKLTVILLFLLFMAAYLVWVERKFLARLQIRYGPNRAGIFGLLQPIADVVKMLTKEDTEPEGADRLFFLLAPAVVASTAFLMFAVVPFGRDITLWGRNIPLVVTDLNIGLLFVFAMSSLGVYGVALGGWSSNSKYALLGGIRGAAQMISYELSLGLSLVPVVMLAAFLQHRGYRSGTGPIPVYPGSACRFPHLRHQRHGREQADSLRSSRSGKRTGCRVPYRIQRNAFRAFLSRRVCPHHGVRGHRLGALSRGLARASVAARRLAPDKDSSRGAVHDLGAGNPAPPAIRPVNDPGMESAYPAGPRKYPGYGGYRAPL